MQVASGEQVGTSSAVSSRALAERLGWPVNRFYQFVVLCNIKADHEVARPGGGRPEKHYEPNSVDVIVQFVELFMREGGIAAFRRAVRGKPS